MTVLDPSRLNLHLPDIDTTAGAGSARTSFDRVAELARDAVAGLELDRHADDLGQRVRDVVQTNVVRAAIARLEHELPEGERDRATRAYLRGRAQARSIWLAVGITAGVSVGVALAVLLDPKHGKARREALKARARGLADRSTHTVRDAVRREGSRTTAAEPAAELEPAAEAVAAIEETLPVGAG
jgi:gas vesicle protein